MSAEEEVVRCVKLVPFVCLFKSRPNRELLLLLSDMVCLQHATATQCQTTSVSVGVVGKHLGTEVQNNTCTFVSISAVAEPLAARASISKTGPNPAWWWWCETRGLQGRLVFLPCNCSGVRAGFFFLSPLFCDLRRCEMMQPRAAEKAAEKLLSPSQHAKNTRRLRGSEKDADGVKFIFEKSSCAFVFIIQLIQCKVFETS